MMDDFLHILLAITIFGFKWEIILGSILPDALYYFAFIKNNLKLTGLRETRLFIWGMRLHSVFLLPVILMSTYIITKNSFFLYLFEAVCLHLLVDMLTHKYHGPRFLWPIIDEFFPRGLVQWHDKKALVIMYCIVVPLFLLKLCLFQ